MKRLFTWKWTALPLLAVLATSCNQERVESPSDTKGPITFNALVGKQTTTRAKEFGYWQSGQTLNVKAYQTGHADTTPYQNFDLIYSGPYTTSWSYSPLVDVPAFSLTYYAYYPVTANISAMTADGTGASFSYTVPDPQEDLVAAMTITPNARVALMFYHLLSEVNFAVQGVQGVKITVSNIMVNGVANSSSTYTFSPSGGSWATPTGSANYAYTPIASVVFPTNGEDSDIIYLGNKGGIVATDNDNGNAMMLMPQTFASGTGGNLTFDYSLTDMDGNVLKSGNTLVYLGDFTTSKWEMGKRYLYLLDFTGLIEEGPITFEVIVFGWPDALPNIAQPVLVADITKILIEKAITTQDTEKATTPSLTVFPISLPTGITLGADVTIVLKDFTGTHFAPGDQLRIQCNTESNAEKILLDSSLLDIVWSRSVNGSVVTLSKL